MSLERAVQSAALQLYHEVAAIPVRGRPQLATQCQYDLREYAGSVIAIGADTLSYAFA